MANAGTNTNGAQFFMAAIQAAWLDGAQIILFLKKTIDFYMDWKVFIRVDWTLLVNWFTNNVDCYIEPLRAHWLLFLHMLE